MARARGILTTTVALALIGCGGSGDDSLAPGDTSAMLTDSLVPIADEPMLPDTSPPAPPETVYVDRAAPPPASRPVTRRPAPSPAPAPAPPPAAAPAPAPAPAALQLASGTKLNTVTMDTITSRTNKPGDQVRVRVAQDVVNAEGATVIPAGSIVTLAIVEIAPAANKGGTGTLTLSARTVTINGTSYPLTARATDYAFEMRGRGVTGREVAKTGAGAVAGAIVGRVIGGKTGTVVGAVGGAAAGAAVADATQDRDIVVDAGSAMVLTLRDEFSRPKGE